MEKMIFSKSIQRLLQALLPHFFPEKDDLGLSDLDQILIEKGSRLIAEFSPFFRWGYLMGLRFFERAPFLFGFGFKRFTSLSFAKQENYINRWSRSSFIAIKEFFKTIRALILMISYADPRVWVHFGYAPEEHLREKIALRQKLLLEETREVH